MKLQEKCVYTMYRTLYRILGSLPWILIDAFAYVATALLYAVIRYRRSIVWDNLRRCFPEKSSLELRELEWAFYCHLVYQFFSAPKILHQPQEVILSKHLRLERVEDLKSENANAILLLMGHLGNWEIFTASSLILNPLGIQIEQLYRIQKSKGLDRAQRELRELHGSLTTPKGDVAKSLIEHVRSQSTAQRLVVFIADQTPTYRHIGLWTKFLGQPTPWLDGAERLGRRLQLPVYYLDVQRINNRQYVGRFVCLTHDASQTSSGDVTRAFAQHIEASIRREPSIWLWSHKRWKYKPSETDTIHS